MQAPEPEPDTRSKELSDLQDQYEDALVDGEKAQAREIRGQIETLRNALDTESTTARDAETRRVAVEDVQFGHQLDRLEGLYDVMNPKHESFDDTKVDEIAELMAGMVGRGASRAVALAKATGYVLGAPPEAAPATAPAPAPVTPAPVAPAPEIADEVAARRLIAEREKGARVQQAQPAASTDIGDASAAAGKAAPDDIGIMSMTEAAFDKLDDDTKARARGDII